MTLETAREEFLKAKAFATRRGTKASPETLKSYKTALRSFEIHVAAETGHSRVMDFTPAMVTSWLMKLDARELSRKAMSSYQTAVREFAFWGLRRGYWRADPMLDVVVIRPPRALPRPFSAVEREALMALPLGPKDAALRGVLYYLALRDASICRLTLGDLEGPSEARAHGIAWTLGKGNKEGVKPFGGPLWALLCAYSEARAPEDRGRTAPLFANQDGSAWRTKTIQRRVHQWGIDAGVENCTPHRWRHTAATDLLTRTNDITKVQKLLGHASLATTQIYAEVVDQSLADAVAMLPEYWPSTPGQDSRTQEGTGSQLHSKPVIP